MSLAPAPGTDTTIRSLPWVTTSAEDTPRPLTRLVMIWRAWSIEDFVGALPPVVCGLQDDLGTALEVQAQLGRAGLARPEDDAVQDDEQTQEHCEITPDAQRSGRWCHGN